MSRFRYNINFFLTYIQSLSALLVADFTLDLRRQNSARIETSNMTLPALQFSNVLQRVHQSFLVELATREERDGGGDGEGGDGSGFPGEIEFAQDLGASRWHMRCQDQTLESWKTLKKCIGFWPLIVHFSIPQPMIRKKLSTDRGL